MNSLVTKVENFVKAADADIVAAANFAVKQVLPELVKLQSDAPVIEGIAALAGPDAANVATVAMNLITWGINVTKDAEAAVGSGGLSVTLDAALVAGLKSVAAVVAPKTVAA